MSFDTGERDPESEEWVAEYGYGAVNWPGRDDAGEEEAVEDPNQDYLTGLSELEQMAYSESLWLEPAEEDLAEDGWYSPTWERAGCYGWASQRDPRRLPDATGTAQAADGCPAGLLAGAADRAGAERVDAACGRHGGRRSWGLHQAGGRATTSSRRRWNQTTSRRTGVRRNHRTRGDRREGDRLGAVDLECRERPTTARRRRRSSSNSRRSSSPITRRNSMLKADAEQGRK